MRKCNNLAPEAHRDWFLLQGVRILDRAKYGKVCDDPSSVSISTHIIDVSERRHAHYLGNDRVGIRISAGAEVNPQIHGFRRAVRACMCTCVCVVLSDLEAC